MKRKTLCIIIGCAALSLNSGAQAATSDMPEVAYRVYLSDKAGSDYCALSPRALERRERFGIALDERDLALSDEYQQALRAQGWQIVTRSRWLNTVVVQPKAGTTLSATDLQQHPFVTRVEKVAGTTETILCAAGPRDGEQGRPKKWKMESVYVPRNYEEDNFRKPIQEVHAETFLDAGLRGEGQLIVVLDGGFQLTDQCEALRSKVIGWHDPYYPQETNGAHLFAGTTHGTFVLSIMACDTTLGVWGTAPDAQYYLIRTEEVNAECPLEEDMWVAGAEMADSLGADLINSSLCYTQFDNSDYDHTWEQLGQNETFITRGAQVAAEKGILVVCAAGNEQTNPWQRIGFPCDCAEVLTVGGTDLWGAPSSFTSIGWASDNVKPEVAARATDAWVYNPIMHSAIQGNGTSYACPLVCGLMASLWSADPTLRPEELKAKVCGTGTNYDTPNEYIGYGWPHFQQALEAINPTLAAIEELSATDTHEPLSGPIYRLKESENGSFIVQNRRKMFVFSR